MSLHIPASGLWRSSGSACPCPGRPSPCGSKWIKEILHLSSLSTTRGVFYMVLQRIPSSTETRSGKDTLCCHLFPSFSVLTPFPVSEITAPQNYLHRSSQARLLFSVTQTITYFPLSLCFSVKRTFTERGRAWQRATEYLNITRLAVGYHSGRQNTCG